MAATIFRALPSKVAPSVIEFIKDTVYYTTLPSEPPPREGILYFSIDDKLVYNNFYLDFGPHSLGSTFQFCHVMNKMTNAVTADKHRRRKIYFYSSPDPQKRANAVCLLTCWGVLFRGLTPQQAIAPFASMSFPPFHDASPVDSDFKLTIVDCLNGLAKAIHRQYVDIETFDVNEYHHYEQVENGDLTWASPKFLAFAGPQNEYSVSNDGYVSLTPEHYVPYFQKNHVTLVVRLNESMYDGSRFTTAGISHLDLYYPDGANPPEDVLMRFLHASEHTPGAVAVHCKAGLGRTGTCIAAYMMKHHRFTAKEAIGWLRLCRPGSVIGPQQEYLESIQSKMWQLGDAMVSQRNKSFQVSVTASLNNSRSYASPPTSPRSPGRGRLFTTRTINIFGVRRSIDLSASGGVTAVADLTATEGPRPVKASQQPTQGDKLRQRKHEYRQGYVR